MCSSVHLHGGAFLPPFPPWRPSRFFRRSKATLNHLTCALSASGELLELSLKLWGNGTSTKGHLPFSTNTMLLGQFKQIYFLWSLIAIQSRALCYSWNVTTPSGSLLSDGLLLKLLMQCFLLFHCFSYFLSMLWFYLHSNRIRFNQISWTTSLKQEHTLYIGVCVCFLGLVIC